MKPNTNIQSHQKDNEYNQSKVKFLIRLRGKVQSSQDNVTKCDNNGSTRIKRPCSKSPSRLVSPSHQNKKQKEIFKVPTLPYPLLSQTSKYSVFTTQPPSNTLAITTKPITGKLIDLTYKTPNDLYEFSQSILKDSFLLEFDKVYNETSKVEQIYTEYFKERVNDLFQGKDTTAFFFGPRDGGKSYILRGGPSVQEQGLLLKIIEGLFNLIDVSKQSYFNEGSNDIFKSYVVKMQVYQVYQERLSDLIGIEGRMLEEKEIRNKKEYDDVLRIAIENRKILAQKLKVNELKRKSSLVIKISLEKRSTDDNRINVLKYSQMTLVELPSSDFALMPSKGERLKMEKDASNNGHFYRNVNGMMINIKNALTAANNDTMPVIDCKLLETMPEVFNKNASFIFFTCVDPFEFPVKHSMKALKFANQIRNQALNAIENDNHNEGMMLYNEGKCCNDNMNQDSDQEYNEIISKQNHGRNQVINTNMSMPMDQVKANENNNNGAVFAQRIANRNSSPMSQQQKNNASYNRINMSMESNHPMSKSIDRSPQQLQTQAQAQPQQQMHSQRMTQKDQLLQKYSYLTSPQSNNNPNINRSNDNNIINIPNQGNIAQSYQDQWNSNLTLNNNQHAIVQAEQTLQDLHNRSAERTNYLSSIKQSNQQSPSHQCHPSNQFQSIEDNNTSALFSDNIILKEDITRLAELNHRMAAELEMERRHCQELDAQLMQITKEKQIISNDLSNMIQKQNEEIEEEENEDLYTKMNNRLVQERKIRRIQGENSTLKITNDKLETQVKIDQEHINELRYNYDKAVTELNTAQMNHSREIEQIEIKIETMVNELEKQQSDNKYLRSTEDKMRYELEMIIKERNAFKDKYMKHKERNNELLKRIEAKDAQIQQMNIDNTMIKQTMTEESRKNKCDNKTKIVSELKSKIDNFRNMTYKNRQCDQSD